MYCMRSVDLWYSSVSCITDTPISLYLLPCTVWGLMVCGTVVSPVSVSSTHLSQCICLPVLYEVWWFVAQLCHLSLYHWQTCETIPASLYCIRSDGMWHTCQTVPASLHYMSSDGVLHSSVSCTTNTSVRLYLFTCTAWGLMVFGTVLSPVSLTRLWDSTCLPVLC